LLDKKLLTVKDLSELLGVSRATIYRWRKLGLPSIQVGRGVRFNAEEVEEWIEKQNEEEYKYGIKSN